MLDEAERRRLTRILGMLGSSHAGERDAAALQAEAFRKRHGLTWEEVFQSRPEAPTPEPPRQPPKTEPPPAAPIRKPPPEPVMASEWIPLVNRPTKPIGYTIGVAAIWLLLFAVTLGPVTNALGIK